MLTETTVRSAQLIQPLFLLDHDEATEEISALPGQWRLGRKPLLDKVEALEALGVGGVALFPCLGPEVKDSSGTAALDPQGLIPRRVRELKDHFPQMTVFTDLALDPFTTHGHDGILTADGKDVDNDATVEQLARMAVVHAQAGADYVCPSDMMDGRVRVIRQHLDAAYHTRTGILSYAAKFNSAFYGPFREAVGSGPAQGNAYLDKSTYQLPPSNRREALHDALLDEEEGADILMVKPAGCYLDVLAHLRGLTSLPLAAYQVSGEYAQIQAAAQLSWLNLKAARDESLLAIRRAGADVIFTYFAEAFAQDHPSFPL